MFLGGLLVGRANGFFVGFLHGPVGSALGFDIGMIVGNTVFEQLKDHC
jgi:hypothetical protein